MFFHIRCIYKKYIIQRIKLFTLVLCISENRLSNLKKLVIDSQTEADYCFPAENRLIPSRHKFESFCMSLYIFERFPLGFMTQFQTSFRARNKFGSLPILNIIFRTSC